MQERRKGTMILKNKPILVYAISVLMLAATATRGLLQAFEINNRFRWLIAGLLVFYGVLLFTDLLLYRRFRHYLKVYFILQVSIVIVLLALPLHPLVNPLTTDFYALLMIPLCVQAIFYFPRPTSYYWVVGFTLASVAVLFYQYGPSDGIKFSVTYILAYTMLFLLAVFYLNAEEAKEELNTANQKLQEYAENAEALAISEERNRLGRDLHDSVTQSLYSLTLFAEAASEELKAGALDTVAEHLYELRQTSQQALQEMRLMIFELHPPELEMKGLALALQERLEAVESRSGIETEIKVGFSDRLPSNIERGLYSIAREAMNNILKHARATKTTIHLTKEGGMLVFEIWDNGIGLDLSRNQKMGLGIKGMEERAAQMGAHLTLEMAANGGTLLKVEVPDVRDD